MAPPKASSVPLSKAPITRPWRYERVLLRRFVTPAHAAAATGAHGMAPGSGLCSSMTYVSEAFSQAEVLDPAGRPQRLGELWHERPVVLVFLRHYG